MAVPKRKTSKAKRDSRRANWKLSAPSVTVCPNCKTSKLPHRIWEVCGYYNGKQIIDKSN